MNFTHLSIYSVVCCLVLSLMVAYFFAFMQLILNLFSSAHNLRQSQGFLLEIFLSKEDPLWLRAKGITTWDLFLPHSPLLPESQACSASLPNLAEWISLKEAENMMGRWGRFVVSLTKSPPGCSVVILGFPRLWWIWCSGWLCIFG